MSTRIKRSVDADTFGPTTGGRVRLADIDLIVEVGKDFIICGEGVKLGGAKVIRDVQLVPFGASVRPAVFGTR